MLLRLGPVFLLLSSPAWAQTDTRAEVRSALEEQAPVPTRPLALPQPAAPLAAATKADQTKARVIEAARATAEEAIKRGVGQPIVDAPGDEKDARAKLGQAGQAAAGQARAAALRKTLPAGKPPRPPQGP